LATVEQPNKYPEIDDLQQLLATRGPRASPARVTEVVWSTTLQVHHRLAMFYRSGRVFLAGDAAHVHSPAGGQGMNTGIQDALHLADKLADVLADGADVSVLNRYEDERRSVAEAVLQLTQRMSTVSTLRGQRASRVRNRVLRIVGRFPAFRHGLAYRLSGLEWARRSGRRSDAKFRYATTLILIALIGIAAIARPIEGAGLVVCIWLAAKWFGVGRAPGGARGQRQ
jgi:2-polyprenyl-6-methoxyphenol hydroxylase-like FAD-dependent oxidoreductase